MELAEEILEKEIKLLKLKIKEQSNLDSLFKGCNKKLQLDSVTYCECGVCVHLCEICESKYRKILYKKINLYEKLVELYSYNHGKGKVEE